MTVAKKKVPKKPARPKLSTGAAKASKLLKTIVDAIQDKKGIDIISLDMTGITDRATDYFVICHGDSSTQVKAIADSVMDKTYDELKEKPWQKEGFENLEWVLIDYINVVVHVFHFRKRQFYQLEDLWSDAVPTVYTDDLK